MRSEEEVLIERGLSTTYQRVLISADFSNHHLTKRRNHPKPIQHVPGVVDCAISGIIRGSVSAFVRCMQLKRPRIRQKLRFIIICFVNLQPNLPGAVYKARSIIQKFVHRTY